MQEIHFKSSMGSLGSYLLSKVSLCIYLVILIAPSFIGSVLYWRFYCITGSSRAGDTGGELEGLFHSPWRPGAEREDRPHPPRRLPLCTEGEILTD